MVFCPPKLHWNSRENIKFQLNLIGDLGWNRPIENLSLEPKVSFFTGFSWPAMGILPRFVLFLVSKNHGRKYFFRLWLKSKAAQRPWFRGTGWPQIRPPRPSEAKNCKIRDFSQFEGWSLLHTSRTHLRPFEAATSEVVRCHDLRGRSRKGPQSDLRGRLRAWPQIQRPRPSEAIWGHSPGGGGR